MTDERVPVLPGEWVAGWQGDDRIAWVFERAEVTYDTFAGRVFRTADWLRAQRVATGDRVSWVGLNRIELFELFLACARIGAIFNPLNNRLTPTELAGLIDDAQPTLIATTDGFAELAVSAVERSGVEVPVIDLDTSQLEPAAVLAAAEPADRPAPESPLLMVFTSGTTGRAKGAVLSQRAVAATVDHGVRSQALGQGDVIIAPLPTFHVGGLNIQTLPTLVAGGTVVLMRRFDPGETLDLIERHRPTQSLLVPAMLTAVAGHPRFEATDLSCLRGVMSGSSIVPASVTAPWFERGVPIGQVYGTTETGPTAVVLEYADAAAHPGSAGRVVPPAQMKVVDADGDAQPTGVAGEILLRGDNLLTEYWQLPEATAAAFADGWYRTGDVGSVDEGGWLTVSDRLGDMIISGGENIYPAEVEAVLGEHPGIAEIAVVGRPDARFGEVGVAFVVPTPGAAPTLEDLRSWAEDRLARFKQPRELVVVESLPRTALGKVTKQVLRAQL
ncbi:MAG: AMP-binding protein [Actinomycetota bacterium]